MCAALVLASLMSPASATPQARLADARSQLRALSAQIQAQSAAVVQAQDHVAAANSRVAAASADLARVQGRRARLTAQLDAARAAWEQSRANLNDLAAEAYMHTAGSLDTSTLAAVLGASSLQDMSDRLAFTSALGIAQAGVAARADAARARLDDQVAAVNASAAAQAALLDQVTTARDDASAALASQAQASAQLAASRDEVVALISRLAKKVREAELGGVGTAFQGPYHVSYGEWAVRFLRQMKVPTCRSNQVVAVAWQVQEFTQAAWNPLATTHPMPGSTTYNGAGVQNYVSLDQGLQATEDTIRGGSATYGYGAIVDALSRCADPMTTAAAVNASAWCSGCTNGAYLVGIVPKVEADFRTYASL
ncbi:MAG: coiled-coil domain-containing protein [Actinomycetota bacterium]